MQSDPQGTNNNSPNTDQAEAAEPTFFAADPLQPGKVHLHLWMLYTPQAPMLDLTGEHIKTKEDIKAAFHSLNLDYVHTMSRNLMAQRTQSQTVKVSTYQTVFLMITR